MKYAFFLFTAVILFSSCSLYKDVEVKEVLQVEILEFDNDGAECEVYVTVFNPNGYKILLTESHIDLFFEGTPLGQVQLLETVTIPKKSQSTIKMKCEANYESLQAILGNVVTLLFKSEYTMEGKGYIKGKALAFSKNVPIEFKQTLTKADLGF